MGNNDSNCCAKSSKEPGIQEKAGSLLGMANDLENMAGILHDRLYGSVPQETCDKQCDPQSLNEVLDRCGRQLNKARETLRDALERL